MNNEEKISIGVGIFMGIAFIYILSYLLYTIYRRRFQNQILPTSSQQL